jgi:phenylacetate-CoA ligase
VFIERMIGTVFLARHLIGQGRYPFRPRQAVLRDQARNVRRMMTHAFLRVPYYRETMARLGLRPEDFASAADLEKLPMLERREIQLDPEKFLAEGVRIERCLHLSTSGSTGAPLTVHLDRRAALLAAAHAERYRRVLVSAVGRRKYRETLIVPLESSHQKHTRFWMGSTLFLGAVAPQKQVLSLFEPPDALIPLVADYAPDIIHSYGSYIEALFARLETWDKPFPRPKAVGFSADGLSDASRRLIQERFGIPCFSAYSAVEATRIGFECEAHAGLHLNEDIYPVRIVDGLGADALPGDPGEVVVSNLVNRAMVILNYRLGDLARRLPGPCLCGRSLPLLSFPEGRRDDWISLLDGRVLPGQYFHVLLRANRSVLQYQLVQVDTARFRLALVVREDADRLSLRTWVLDAFTKALGRTVSIDLSFVRDIPRTGQGKVRPIVSLINVPGSPARKGGSR